MSTQSVVIQVPDEILASEKMDAKTFGRELGILAAAKMFELGRLGAGRAAELAGMSKIEFLAALKDYAVCPLEPELRDLERGHAGH